MSEKSVHIVFQVINNLRQLIQTSSAEKLVLITLASFNGVKGICPSVKTISARIGMCERQVYRALQRLEKQNLIKIHRKAGYGNSFELLFLSTTPDILVNEPLTSCSTTPDILITTPLTSCSQTPDYGVTPYNKEVTDRKTERGRTRRAMPLSHDFEPSRQSIEVAKNGGLTEEEANIEFDKFMNFYLERGDEKSDWNLMLQNWLLRAVDFKRKKPAQAPKEEVRSTVPWFNPADAQVRGAEPVARLLHGLTEQAKIHMSGGKPNGLGSNGEREEGKGGG